MTKRIYKIFELLSACSCEIVSYGLAPNPDGFCYEYFDEDGHNRKDYIEEEKQLNKLLDQLSNSEIEKLRNLTF